MKCLTNTIHIGRGKVTKTSTMTFNSTSPGTVGPAIISFLAGKDYIDCIKLAISLGGDADTLATVAGPMAFAHYKYMPEPLVYKALKMLPDWMQKVNADFDKICHDKQTI